MKMLSRLRLYILSALVLLAGCSVFSNPTERDTFKSEATSTKPLTIPEDLNSTQVKDYYPLPKIEKPFKETGTISIIPPGSNIKK